MCELPAAAGGWSGTTGTVECLGTSETEGGAASAPVH